MTNTPATRAKRIMDACDAMHDDMCAKYGEGSEAAMYAVQMSVQAFILFCTLEQLEANEVGED